MTRAQDHVRLSEVMPALRDSDLGALALGAAPPPGSSRVVRGSEIRRALQRAGRSAQGMRIPATTTVRRRVRELDQDAIEAAASEPLRAALAPCRVTSVRWPRSLRVARGRLSVRSEATRPSRSGSVSAQLIFDARGRSTRLPVRAQVDCPPPLLQPGARVNIEIIVKNVRASVPGEVRQSGRVGDHVRVTNLNSRRTMVAEVVDADTVRLR